MLILVRHGQTRANAAGLLQGRADLPLTEAGAGQAEALGKALGGPARIISSPLARARHTAEIIGGGGPVELDERWIELDYGQYDQQPLGSLPPGEWDRWREDPQFRLPGGETLSECGQRVRAACADLASAAVDEDVVVVSHVSPIKAAVAWALGAADPVTWRMHLAVASVTRVGFTRRGPMLLSYNETHHLESFTGA
jgi:broad specificity phosphatase PhoE